MSALLLVAACGYRLEPIPRTYQPNLNGQYVVSASDCPSTARIDANYTTNIIASDGFWLGITPTEGPALLYNYPANGGRPRCFNLQSFPVRLARAGPDRLTSIDRWGGQALLILSEPAQLRYVLTERQMGQSLLHEAPPILALAREDHWVVIDGERPEVIQLGAPPTLAWRTATAARGDGCNIPASGFGSRTTLLGQDSAYYALVRCAGATMLVRSEDFTIWTTVRDLSGDLSKAYYGVELRAVGAGAFAARLLDPKTQHWSTIIVQARTGEAHVVAGPYADRVVARWSDTPIALAVERGRFTVLAYNRSTGDWQARGGKAANCATVKSASDGSNRLMVACWVLRPRGPWTRQVRLFRTTDGGATWSEL